MFGYVPRPRPTCEVAAVLASRNGGLTDRETARATGVPVSTIRRWRQRGLSRRAQRELGLIQVCPDCGSSPHDFGAICKAEYSYLLGIYLGDGTLRCWGTAWILRIALDSAYPFIVEECRAAIASVRGGEPPDAKPDYGDKRCVRIEATWRQWPCYFPQHGPGRKHSRPIELASWQQHIVDSEPGPFLRGLIHSDGWRGTNKVRVKGKVYKYPRYQFSNRSDDIRRPFTDACDRLGVKWRPWTRYHVSVAQRDSVAILDTFVGPKT
jgi:hypothetical protein